MFYFDMPFFVTYHGMVHSNLNINYFTKMVNNLFYTGCFPQGCALEAG
jgi:hypothetical protein